MARGGREANTSVPFAATRGNHRSPDVSDVRELFARHGLRCTRQRELVYEALAATRCHPTAEELLHLTSSRVAPGEAALSLATVYNTLEVFTEVGLARRLPCPQGTGACRYDADTTDHVHLARADGQIVDLPQDLSDGLLSRLPPDLLAEVQRRMGVRVSGVSLQVVAGRDTPGLPARE